LNVFQRTLSVRTSGRGLFDITTRIREVVAESAISVGTCHVFCAHTSASLVIQENADPAVLRDLGKWIERIAPEDAHAYEHDDEGLDDMPAHLRTSITRTAETMPITNGKLALGTWQALYLWEHRARPHERKLTVTILGV
jgi:secondary thiamine-phosphate synthase enzyme